MLSQIPTAAGLKSLQAPPWDGAPPWPVNAVIKLGLFVGRRARPVWPERGGWGTLLGVGFYMVTICRRRVRSAFPARSAWIIIRPCLTRTISAQKMADRSRAYPREDQHRKVPVLRSHPGAAQRHGSDELRTFLGCTRRCPALAKPIVDQQQD